MIKILTITLGTFSGLFSLLMFIYLWNAANEDPDSNSSHTEITDDAETSSRPLVPETTHSSFGVSPVNIPRDQMRMVENINALISEVGYGPLKTSCQWYISHLSLLNAHYCLEKCFFHPYPAKLGYLPALHIM